MANAEYIQTEKRLCTCRMSRFNWLRFGYLIALCTLTSGNLWGGERPQIVTVPPNYVYKSMLEFCNEKEYDKIEKSIPFVQPIFEKIQEDFAIDLEKEIRNTIDAGKQQEICNVIRKIIFWDMKDLLGEVLKPGEDSDQQGMNPIRQVRTLLKAAYLDYLLLSPEVKRRQFGADQMLKNLFKHAHAEVAEPDRTALKIRLDQIDTQLLVIFPHFKRKQKSEQHSQLW